MADGLEMRACLQSFQIGLSISVLLAVTTLEREVQY